MNEQQRAAALRLAEYWSADSWPGGLSGVKMDETAALLRELAADVNQSLTTEQEPVASIYITPSGDREFDDWKCQLPVGRNVLYAAPPQRQPLSDEQIDELVLQVQFLLICDGLEELKEIARAVERAHGIGETK